MNNLRLKFKSGNDVPVTEARITRKEFEVIEAEIAKLKESRTIMMEQNGQALLEQHLEIAELKKTLELVEDELHTMFHHYHCGCLRAYKNVIKQINLEKTDEIQANYNNRIIR